MGHSVHRNFCYYVRSLQKEFEVLYHNHRDLGAYSPFRVPGFLAVP